MGTTYVISPHPDPPQFPLSDYWIRLPMAPDPVGQYTASGTFLGTINVVIGHP